MRRTERISGIVRQMFDLYRPVATHETAADVSAILNDIRALLAPSLRERSIDIITDVPPQASKVSAPESMLRPAIFNVLQNAVEASPSGGMIQVTSLQQDDFIELRIADQGNGIPEANNTKIFEPFFTTKDGLSTGGLGLGLAIAKSTIEALGGTIDFGARAEGGTEFRIRVPRAGTPTTEDEG